MNTDNENIATLTQRDLPVLYGSADKTSLSGQTFFLSATLCSLSLLVIAAIAGAFTIRSGDSADISGIVAAFAFGLALLIRIYILSAKPDKRWYEGRAAAESVKTLAWRYAVSGEPFVQELAPAEADSLFARRLEEVLTDLGDIDLRPAGGSVQITAAMRQIRATNLSERRASYEVGRINNQHKWYSNKARFHGNSATILNISTLLAEAVGLVGAILKATTIIEFDALGIAAAVAAGFTAWELARQHSAQATAYGIAAQELATIASLIQHTTSEAEWGRFVDGAEEAVSREHQLWRASHGLPIKAVRAKSQALNSREEER